MQQTALFWHSLMMSSKHQKSL